MQKPTTQNAIDWRLASPGSEVVVSASPAIRDASRSAANHRKSAAAE
jgi:hypothetical protein